MVVELLERNLLQGSGRGSGVWSLLKRGGGEVLVSWHLRYHANLFCYLIFLTDRFLFTLSFKLSRQLSHLCFAFLVWKCPLCAWFLKNIPSKKFSIFLCRKQFKGIFNVKIQNTDILSFNNCLFEWCVCSIVRHCIRGKHASCPAEVVIHMRGSYRETVY